MKKLADVQLLEMVNDDPSRYQPEALEAAKIELNKRNLTFEERKEAELNLNERQARKEQSLDSGERFWFALMCWQPRYWVRSMQLHADGYETKSIEARAIMKKYLVFFIIAVVVFIIFMNLR